MDTLDVHWTHQTMAPLEPRLKDRRHYWTTKEVALLREHFPRHGVSGCVEHLPRRTPAAIYQKAMLMGLVAEARKSRGRPARRPQLIWTEQIDDAIRRAYASPGAATGIKALARSLGRNHASLRARALKLGIVPPQFKPANWSERENAIIRASEGMHPKRVRLRLKKAGFIRTEVAVCCRMTDLRVSRVKDDPDIWSARDLGEVMGVDSHAPARWIEQGWLKAKKTDGVRGAYRIKRADIRDFLIDHAGRWDHRKCDIHWLVDILAK